MTVETDIALEFDCERLFFDFPLNEDGSDLKGATILENAILISHFTDRRTGPDDTIPDSRGWPGDGLADEDTPKIGSRLWLLTAAKTTENTLIRAEDYLKESVQWLIEDLIVREFIIQVSYLDKPRGIMQFLEDVIMPTGENLRFQFAWDQIKNKLLSTNG